MSGDYSRFTFDPKKNYSSVLKQQGRVSLDADANEAAAIQDRRWRAETMDIFGGRCVVPVGPDGNKDAFLITPFRDTANNRIDLRIGVGRMYVDGLLVENHGDEEGDQRFELPLEEMRGTHPATFYTQPDHHFFRRDDGAIPHPSLQKPYLVYLCAWQREITVLQDPAVLETALGGPDTANRLQTVWQVKVKSGVGDAKSCEDDNLEPSTTWSSLTAPSDARLTVTTQATPGNQPCELSPEGGYRGPENRLYRVEIHDVAQNNAGEHTSYFKWSRDNASVATAVEAIEEVPDFPSRRKLRLATLGRDPYLRFEAGNRVELLDDRMELRAYRGFMAHIVSPVNEADRTVIVEISEPVDEFKWYEDEVGFDPADVAALHTRLRRWDQTEVLNEGIGSNGLLEAGDERIHLEHGIWVQLGPDPDVEHPRFMPGDYWVFAARTASGEVDELVNAPPRGIHRHYCRLALFRWVDGVLTPEDCRNHWPPEIQAGAGQGCCTVIVGPEQSIQKAIEDLDEAGGCVCLRAGTYDILEPICIENRSNVVLQGASTGALIRCPLPLQRLVYAHNARNLSMRGLTLELSPNVASTFDPWGPHVVECFQCETVELQDCILVNQSTTFINVTGITVTESTDVRIKGNQFQSIAQCIEANEMKTLVVTDNVMQAPEPTYVNQIAVDVSSSEHVSVINNRIEGFFSGVSINDILGQSAIVVRDNDINTAEHDSKQDPCIYISGSDLAVERQSVIENNRVSGSVWGIVVDHLHGVKVKNNTVFDFQFGIFLYSAIDVTVEGNRITACNKACVNAINGSLNRLVQNYLGSSDGYGILVGNEASLEVHDNTLEDVRAGGLVGQEVSQAVTLSRNRFYWCGSAENAELSVLMAHSIEIYGHLDDAPQVTIESCYVFNTGMSREQQSFPSRAIGVHIHGAASCRIQSNELLTTTQRFSDKYQALPDCALLAEATPEPRASRSALVLNNRIEGFGGSHMVEFAFSYPFPLEDGGWKDLTVTFSNNVCEHTEANPEIATVAVKVTTSQDWLNSTPGPGRLRLIAMGNSVSTRLSEPHQAMAKAFFFPGMAHVVLMGNVVDGSINVNGGTTVPLDHQIPLPYEDFNWRL